MKILFLGDISWRAGRRIVKEFVPKLREEFKLDAVIANGENAKHGKGMSLDVYEELTAAGVDCFTSGEHIWDDQDFIGHLNRTDIKVIRPANYPAGAPGRGVERLIVNNEILTIVNLQGRVFFNPNLDNPFATFDKLLPTLEGFTLIDFHAEASSEKNTFAHYVDGRVGAIIGTHTHIQTADERILPKGTAYISDVGMCGPLNGSIGADLKYVTQSFTLALPFKLEPAPGPVQLNGAIVTVENSRAIKIERIQRFLD